MLTEYDGVLRLKATVEDQHLQLEWFDAKTKIVIWTERIKLRDNYSMVSQIGCDGHFTPSTGYYVDGSGFRHFAMKCDPGQLGVLGQQLQVAG